MLICFFLMGVSFFEVLFVKLKKKNLFFEKIILRVIIGQKKMLLFLKELLAENENFSKATKF